MSVLGALRYRLWVAAATRHLRRRSGGIAGRCSAGLVTGSKQGSTNTTAGQLAHHLPIHATRGCSNRWISAPRILSPPTPSGAPTMVLPSGPNKDASRTESQAISRLDPILVPVYAAPPPIRYAAARQACRASASR